jgi:hypothetical protein
MPLVEKRVAGDRVIDIDADDLASLALQLLQQAAKCRWADQRGSTAGSEIQNGHVWGKERIDPQKESHVAIIMRVSAGSYFRPNSHQELALAGLLERFLFHGIDSSRALSAKLPGRLWSPTTTGVPEQSSNRGYGRAGKYCRVPIKSVLSSFTTVYRQPTIEPRSHGECRRGGRRWRATSPSEPGQRCGRKSRAFDCGRNGFATPDRDGN